MSLLRSGVIKQHKPNVLIGLAFKYNLVQLPDVLTMTYSIHRFTKLILFNITVGHTKDMRGYKGQGLIWKHSMNVLDFLVQVKMIVKHEQKLAVVICCYRWLSQNISNRPPVLWWEKKPLTAKIPEWFSWVLYYYQLQCVTLASIIMLIYPSVMVGCDQMQ